MDTFSKRVVVYKNVESTLWYKDHVSLSSKLIGSVEIHKHDDKDGMVHRISISDNIFKFCRMCLEPKYDEDMRKIKGMPDIDLECNECTNLGENCEGHDSDIVYLCINCIRDKLPLKIVHSKKDNVSWFTPDVKEAYDCEYYGGLCSIRIQCANKVHGIKIPLGG